MLLSTLLFVCFGAVSATTISEHKGALATINKAKPGSKKFVLVDSYDCDNEMVATVREFFKANCATFDTCISESGYQMYPFTGILPDAKTLVGLVNSASCIGIITSVVLLKMPPCQLNDLPMLAACEVILYYSLALRDGVEPPTTEQFSDLMTWRQDVDLAKAAAKPYDGKSQTYAVFMKSVRKVLRHTKVSIMDNFTVILDDQEADSIEMADTTLPSFVSTNSSMDYFVGRVVAAKDAFDDPPLTSQSVIAHSSDVTTLRISSTFALILLAAAVIVLVL